MKIWRPLRRIFTKGWSDSKDDEDLIGQIARSVSGRDEGTLYVITGKEDGMFVTVSDGARRTVSDPKRKNVRHLLLTGQRIPDEFIRHGKVTASDGQIAKLISEYPRFENSYES